LFIIEDGRKHYIKYMYMYIEVEQNLSFSFYLKLKVETLKCLFTIGDGIDR